MRERTNITLHPHTKEQAMKHAAADGRSLSELVERLLEEYVSGGIPLSELMVPTEPKTEIKKLRTVRGR